MVLSFGLTPLTAIPAWVMENRVEYIHNIQLSGCSVFLKEIHVQEENHIIIVHVYSRVRESYSIFHYPCRDCCQRSQPKREDHPSNDLASLSLPACPLPHQGWPTTPLCGGKVRSSNKKRIWIQKHRNTVLHCESILYAKYTSVHTHAVLHYVCIIMCVCVCN